MRRKGHSKITAAVRRELHDWVLNHPRVVNSPIANETLFVENKDTLQRERVGKLLLEISVRELHNDLIELPPDQGGKGGGLACARGSDGKIIISDTSLRYWLPPQLKPMTERHKQMCGCEACLEPDSLQKTLNAWRVRHKRELLAKVKSLPNGPAKRKAEEAARKYMPQIDEVGAVPWHLKPRLALGEIQCHPVAPFLASRTGAASYAAVTSARPTRHRRNSRAPTSTLQQSDFTSTGTLRSARNTASSRRA